MRDQFFPDFPREEFELRYRRAREHMDAHNLEALFITAPTNYAYFTGHRSDVNLADKARPYVCLLPRNGDPVVFVMAFEEGHVRLTTWIEDVRTYDLFRHNDVFEEAIRELGLGECRIGAELGREQYMKLSYSDFTDLQSRLPKASFVDAAEVFLTLRSVKSPLEAERCRVASEATARALDRTFNMIKVGMTNLDVARLVRRYAVDEGAEKFECIEISSGHDFTAMGGKISHPVPRVLEEGDTLAVDVSVQIEGYCSDVCRTVVMGRAQPEQEDLYEFVIDLNHKCYEAVRAGSSCGDVVRACQEELKKTGRKTQGVGRIGHGVGCDGAEYPSLALDEKVEIQPGMVFACNPNFRTEIGFFNVEENILVTEDGYQFLSRPLGSPTLPVIG